MAIRSCFSSCLPRKPSAPQGNSKEICATKDNIDLESGTGKGFKIDWKMLGFLPLMFMIFYDVSGGPFGIEDAVGAAGPFYAIVGFAVFPLIWSIPEAMITAELGTMFLENGGYVRWVSAAFGPYWGFQEGWMKWLSGIIDNGVYPGLFLEYLQPSIPALQRSKIKTISALAITVFLTFIDYLGLVLVGWTVVILGISTLLPFAIMGIIAIPKMKPRRLLEGKFKDIDWNLYLNTLFWNLNYWDSISTVSGEVKNPKRNLAKAIFSAVVLVAFTYLISLITTTAAVPYVRENWSDGYFTDVATILGGAWLRYWVQGAAAASNMGNFIAEMSGDSFQLLGMAERGMLPAFFARRSRFGTPWVAILFSCLGVIALQWMTMQEIIAAENFLYCFGMVLEFLAFIRLRVVMPNAPRPYKVPLGTVGGTLMCIPPTIMIGAVLRFSELKVFLVSLGAILIGLVLYPVLMYIKKNNWLEFIDDSEFDEEEEQEKLDEHSTKAEVTNS